MKQKNKHHILTRYGVIIGFFLFLSLVITGKLFYTTLVDAAPWNNRAKREFAKTKEVQPERGDILADNGNILACDLQVYDIQLDMAHQGIKNKRSTYRGLDSLADSLDVYYPMKEGLEKMSAEERKEHSWHTRLEKQLNRDRNDRNRAIFIKKAGTLDDYNRIASFPYLRNFPAKRDRKSPLYATPRSMRTYPFGKMAALSIGRVNIDQKTGRTQGYSGLERDLNSLLYGKPGISKKVALTAGLSDWIERKPVRGYDVHTTINIDLQDMLEEELRRICIQAKAVWGTALLMEVKTGAIKAISNMELVNGEYGEALNRAVLAYEPGSVMKPISMMVAFEDGLVKSVNDVVDTSPFQGTTDRHAPPVKTMKQVIEMSSNTGIARVIFRGYQQHPENYHKRLEQLGFFEPFHTGLDQERVPYVPELKAVDSKGNKVTMTARLMSLARQTYGYNTMVPPLYTAAFYNAIANDGVLVYPRLIRSLRDENGRDSIIPQKSKRVCSPETARKVRECIREVVQSKHGTGHILADDRVEIAGKTGTAFPISHGVYDMSYRRFAFAGFFPYENPKYTMMVLILAPGGNSAARTSGQVMLNMALRLYSRGMLDNVSTYTTELSDTQPVLASTSLSTQLPALRPVIGNSRPKRLQTTPANSKGMPDVTGYDAAAAVALLEKRGINVRLSGQGYVVGQSIAPGAPAPKGTTVTLTLKI